MSTIFKNLVALPWLWNIVQQILGAPEFKKKLYQSVLHPPGKLLDFGCASGHLAGAFTEFDYTGLDIDPDTIRGASDRFKDVPNMKFIAADIFTRPFDPNSFDEVLFACTVHHLTDTLLTGILRELAYVLKPGGILHIIDPVLQAKDGWSEKFLRRIDQGKFPRSAERIIEMIKPLHLFEIGSPSFHPPYGALIQDCDFMHLALKKL
jgi:SAM-dependent methyltransferase